MDWRVSGEGVVIMGVGAGVGVWDVDRRRRRVVIACQPVWEEVLTLCGCVIGWYWVGYTVLWGGRGYGLGEGPGDRAGVDCCRSSGRFPWRPWGFRLAMAWPPDGVDGGAGFGDEVEDDDPVGTGR